MGNRSVALERQRDLPVDDVYASATVVAAADATYHSLTSQNVVLLLIDHQVGPLWDLEFAETRRAVVTLADLATRLGIPTVVTAIAPETWGSTIPELTRVVGSDAVHVVRVQVNAWENASVRDAIDRTGRKKLIVAGGAAPVAVALCALSAAAAGYEVYTPMDASAQFSHASIRRLSRADVILTTTALITAELRSRAPR